MTRENKLALVIGFGLILFVGILVSDHFSAQRFDPVDVTKQASATPAGELSIHGMGGAPVDLAPSVPGAKALTPAGSEAPVQIATVDNNAPLSVETVGGESAGTPVRFHKVQKGDTYWSIAAKEYGDGSLATKLQDYNKAAAPDAARLALNADLRIPPIEVLRPGAVAKADGTNVNQTKPVDAVASRTPATYTIQKGDTPYRIAKERGIRVADLLSANGIKDPSALKPGQTLKIPAKF